MLLKKKFSLKSVGKEYNTRGSHKIRALEVLPVAG